MSRLFRVLCIACALAILPLTPARACSCVNGDPRDMFEAADGAFVGTFIESHPVEPDPSSSAADTIYTFRLDEEYKGELGEPGDLVEVHAPLSGASCGIEAQPGQDYGLFLRLRNDGAWSSGLCSQVSPERMREAASPLPSPTSERPVRLVAGGSFGDMQTMMLDRGGRTVDYGAGGHDVTYVDPCEGGKRVLEVGRLYPDPYRLMVRNVASGEVVRTVELPFGPGQRFRSMWIGGIGCLSEDGRRAVVFATNQREPEARSILLKVTGSDKEVLHEGSGRSVTFGDGVGFVQQGDWGRDLTQVSLRTGAETPLMRLPARYSTELALSPDGTKLGGIAFPAYDQTDEKPARLYTVDLSGSRATLRTQSLGTGERYAYLEWMSDRRLVMFTSYPDQSRVFNLRLRAVSRFGRWAAQEPALVGRTAYGVDWDGRLLRVTLPDGNIEVVRRLPSPVVFDLEAVEG
ncbi:MAG: hypothetical protein ACLGIB_10190 [Actinomycetota bacterium]